MFKLKHGEPEVVAEGAQVAEAEAEAEHMHEALPQLPKEASTYLESEVANQMALPRLRQVVPILEQTVP